MLTTELSDALEQLMRTQEQDHLMSRNTVNSNIHQECYQDLDGPTIFHSILHRLQESSLDSDVDLQIALLNRLNIKTGSMNTATHVDIHDKDNES